MHLVDGRPGGDVDVLAGIVQGLSREGHPVLPTHQAPDAPDGSLDRAHAVRVTRSPHETL